MKLYILIALIALAATSAEDEQISVVVLLLYREMMKQCHPSLLESRQAAPRTTFLLKKVIVSYVHAL